MVRFGLAIGTVVSPCYICLDQQGPWLFRYTGEISPSFCKQATKAVACYENIS